MTTGYAAACSLVGLVTPRRCWSRLKNVWSPSLRDYFRRRAEVTSQLGRRRGTDLRVGAGQVFAVREPQPGASPPSLRARGAHPVELALQQPVAAEVAAVSAELRQHQRDRHAGIVPGAMPARGCLQIPSTGASFAVSFNSMLPRVALE